MQTQTEFFDTSAYMTRTSFKSKPTDERYTPPEICQLIESAMYNDSIDLDCCAEPEKATPAKRHLTKTDNCLIHVARNETIFCQPPYSNITPFIEWTSLQVLKGNSPQAIVLCQSGAMHNKSTRNIIRRLKPIVCHYTGRIKFTSREQMGESIAENESRAAAKFDSVFINFGKVGNFFEVFDQYGLLTEVI